MNDTPPTPADADLRHYKSMPLDVARLRDSEIASDGNAEGFRCAVLLWCTAWHQIPAGSLPTDGATLARMAGLGRDMKGWASVRGTALRGWREFDDGRLYHPVVAEKVIDAWNSTLQHDWQRACDRTRKENGVREKAGRQKLEMPSRPLPISLRWPTECNGASKHIPPEERYFPPEGPTFPPENGLKGREGNESSSSKISTDAGGEAQRDGSARLAPSLRSKQIMRQREAIERATAVLAERKRMSGAQ